LHEPPSAAIATARSAPKEPMCGVPIVVRLSTVTGEPSSRSWVIAARDHRPPSLWPTSATCVMP